MRKAGSPARHAGFTMVEVIVVMGIIAILAAVMMPLLRGSNDSAMTAQCRDNMRNLAQGVLSYAQSNGEEGYFPSAGFYRWIWGVDINAGKDKKGELVYAPHVPWISNYGNFSDLKSRKTKVIMGDVVSFTDSNEKKIRSVIEHGAIWNAVGTAYEVYRCPVHARNFKKKKGRLPGWSFMMNQEFGYRGDDDDGVRGLFGATFGSNITVSMEKDGTRGSKKRTASRSPDKVLLFAEVQGADVEDKKHGISLKALVSGSNRETDAVLEYADEDMGFTHPLGKGRYGGNVAFADGHVDTITMPTDKSYLKLITRYLCQGYDVPHDGRVYTPTTGVDDR